MMARLRSSVIKEIREIEKLKGMYSDSIIVSTLILAVVKGNNRNASHGVKLERIGTDSYSNNTSVLIHDEFIRYTNLANDYSGVTHLA